MKIIVNGSMRECAEHWTVAALIESMELTGKKIAVELNKEILPYDQYSAQELKEGDRVEIVHAIGGGQDDFFVVAGVSYRSRLLVGTGAIRRLALVL